MERLRNHVLQDISARQNGSRAIATDDTVVILDCPAWHDANSHSIRSRFPQIDVDIETTQDSLSGFKITMRKRPSSHRVYLWAGVLGLILASLSFSLWRLQNAPLLS